MKFHQKCKSYNSIVGGKNVKFLFHSSISHHSWKQHMYVTVTIHNKLSQVFTDYYKSEYTIFTCDNFSNLQKLKKNVN